MPAGSMPSGRGGLAVVRTAPLTELIGYALRRAQGVVHADLHEALAGIELRPLQYTLLLMIAENPGATQSSLCEALGMQKANCVPAMGALERRGFIQRRKSATDARSYALHLTARGRRILQRAGEVQSSHERRLIARIGTEGRDQLISLLGKLTDLR
jgi:DNA-binding MarR family transcriptional regulator